MCQLILNFDFKLLTLEENHVSVSYIKTFRLFRTANVKCTRTARGALHNEYRYMQVMYRRCDLNLDGA